MYELHVKIFDKAYFIKLHPCVHYTDNVAVNVTCDEVLQTQVIKCMCL